MALTIYRSSDVGAPTLSFAAGSFIALLDACLRTGYGSKAGAGWTKPFTGANIAVFKQGAGGNNRFIRVWDARAGTDPATSTRTANVRGYETMTAVSTGTNPFPTTSQSGSNGLMVRYAVDSALGSPAPNEWMVRANSNWFDVHISTGGSGYPTYACDGRLIFGSFPSLKSGDTFNDLIVADANNAYTFYAYTDNQNGSAYVSRSDTGVVGAKEAMITNVFGDGNDSYTGNGFPTKYPYPARVNNTMLIHPLGVYCDGQLRGALPGLWSSVHGVAAIGFGNTFGGNGALAGRSFETFAFANSGGGFIAEMSDTFTGL